MSTKSQPPNRKILYTVKIRLDPSRQEPTFGKRILSRSIKDNAYVYEILGVYNVCVCKSVCI